MTRERYVWISKHEHELQNHDGRWDFAIILGAIGIGTALYYIGQFIGWILS